MGTTLNEGDVLAQKYEIVRLLGRGGMGVVYEVRNRIGRRFALKVLLQPELAEDKRLAARFLREAKTSASIESQHIVEVYDSEVDEATGLPFILMELLRGEDLEQLVVREGALPVATCARILVQAATGLAKAHEAGVIHRDIKPANIFLSTKDGTEAVVKILDFGIAKESLALKSHAEKVGLTKSGALLGTPLYMSPEQTQGAKHIDARTDVWSLGACLYYALAKTLPWGEVHSLGALVMRICTQDATPIRSVAPWVSEELAAVVHRALARSVESRTPSANAFIEQLRPYCEGSTRLGADLLEGADLARAHASSTPPISQRSHLSAGAMSASRIDTRRTASKTRGRVVAIGVVASLAIVGGVALRGRVGAPIAVNKAEEVPGRVVSAATRSSTASALAAASIAPSRPELPEVRPAFLKLHVPPGSRVTVDNAPVEVLNGGISLTGPVEKVFFVSVYKDGELLITQKEYIAEGFVAVPDVLDADTAKATPKPPPRGVAGRPPVAVPAPSPTPPAPAPTKAKPYIPPFE